MKKYEYKIEDDLTDGDIEILGNEGWQLVSVIYGESYRGELFRTFYFIREKQDEKNK